MPTVPLQALRHSQALLLACLILATLLSWWYLVRMAEGMPTLDTPMAFQPWATFSMWMVMMVGMMLPGATPGILMFVGGVMSLACMALLTLVILLEKVIAPWKRLADTLGLVLVSCGGWLIFL